MKRLSRSLLPICLSAASAFVAPVGAQTQTVPSPDRLDNRLHCQTQVLQRANGPAPTTTTTTTDQSDHTSTHREIAPDLKVARDAFKSLSAQGWNQTALEHLVEQNGVLIFRGQPLSASHLSETPLPVVTSIFDESDALREFGCTDVLLKQFQRGMRNINVIAYRFSSVQGAYGAYSNMREGATNVLVRGDRSSEDDRAISFQRGNYFLRIATSAEDDDEAKEVVTKFADTLAGQIAANASQPALMSRLPAIDRVRGSERLFMGAMTARRHTSIPYIGQLNIEQSLGSAYADYQFAPPLSERMKLIIVEFLDARAAQEVFSRYVETLRDVHQLVVSSGNTALFKLSDNFLYCQTTGKDIVVISGARKRISPLMLARQLGSM
jgi:hypothetical protein